VSDNFKTMFPGVNLPPLSADPLNPENGDLQFADGTVRAEGLWEFRDGNWHQVGGGNGGGLDVFFTETFEITKAADLTTGNSSDFDDGGSAAATPTDNTSTPIKGDSSLQYVQVSGSLDDWGASESINISNKESGNNMIMKLYGTYTGDKGDIAIALSADGVLISDDEDIFTQESNPNRFVVTARVPSAATSLKWGLPCKS